MEETFERANGETSRRLWTDLLVGPVVWAVHFLVVYVLAEAVCMGGRIAFPLIDGTVLNLIILAVTVAALGLVVWRGLPSYRAWRGSPSGRDVRSSTGRWAAEDRTAFMALAGFLLSGFFTLVILLVVFPFLLLQPCGVTLP
jgi:hypothetical protein